MRPTRSYVHSLSLVSGIGKCIRNCHVIVATRIAAGTAVVTATTKEDDDDHVLYALLNQCSDANHVYQIHGFMVARGLDQDNLNLSRFIQTCSALGLLEHGYSAFNHKTHPDIYLYNTMIKALISRPPHPVHDSNYYSSCAREAILLYCKARLHGLRLDSYTFPFALKAVSRLSAVELGREIHCQAIGTGLDGNVHVGIALIQMYSSVGRVPDARKVFEGMRVRDLASWNAMIAGHVKVGDLGSARALFEEMPEKNVISWTSLIAGYARVNHPTEAIAIFTRMQHDGVQPDEVAMLAALSACAQLGAIELGEWIHNYINEHKLSQTISLNNALIDMYAKSGIIAKAIDVFEGMKERSVVTWTTAIAGLASHGLGREALEMFSRMERASTRPNDVTLLAVLSACSHGGLIETGRWFFKNVVSKYGIQLRIEHYGCMVDLLGRSGCLLEAQELIRKMPFEANGAIWGSLLAASRIHGDVELGERALRHLIEVEPYNSGNYSLMCNIYGAVGRWGESGMTRKVMRNTGIKKVPAGSCIQVNNRVHEFNAGRSHPQSEMVFNVLYQLKEHLEIAGYMFMEPWDLF